MPKALPVSLLLLVSGTCSLLFQTAWFREFRLVFGASTYSSAAVMAIFMGGLGLGNALLGRKSDQTARPLQLYAKFEILISIWGALTPFFVDAVRFLYLSLGGQETLGIFGATAFRLLGTALVIGVPTFLMGGTLPAAVKAITRDDDHGRGTVGILYGVNTFGAVLGCLLGTFYLFEMFGTRTSLWLACAANLVNALVAWSLAAKANSPTPVTTGSSQPTASLIDMAAPITNVPPWALYLSAALIGAAFFLMEMVWYRMLGPILGGSTFTFGLILAVALSGIGLGGAIYSRRFGSRSPDLGTFIQTLTWEALALAVPFWLGDFLAILAMQLRGFAIYGFWGQAAGWLVVTLIVVFPASVIAGIQFPVLIALVGRGTKDIGRELGQTFAWNTIGSMIGSFAGGFGLMSLLTAPGVWKLAVIMLIVLAVLLARHQFGSARWQALGWQFGAALLALLCVFSEGPTAIWRQSGIGAGRSIAFAPTMNDFRKWSNQGKRSLLWEHDGRESAVGINASDSLAFIVNGKSDGNAVRDAGTQIMLGMIGAFQHPNPKRALVIGLGTGESAGWLGSLDSMQQVDVIELEPAVIKMAQLCAPLNHTALENPKVRVIINDAREQMLTTSQQYDLICSEPSNPYRSGISSLYTKEFYQSAAQRLSDDGIFCQWLQSYEVDSSTVRNVLATLRSVFPYVEVWWTQPGDLVLTCSMKAKSYNIKTLSTKLSKADYLLAARTAWQTEQVEGLLLHAIANDQFVSRLCSKGCTINTDDHNILEYGFARSVGKTGGFRPTQLRKRAESLGERWPTSISESFSANRVSEITVAIEALRGTDLETGDFESDQASIWRAFGADNFLAAANEIAGLSDEQLNSLDYVEQILLTTIFAKLRDPRLANRLKAIDSRSPGCAMGIAALFAVDHADEEVAANQLAKFFDHLRIDATTPSFIYLTALVSSQQLVVQKPDTARLLYDSLRKPFSLMLAQESRHEALIAVALAIGANELTGVFLELEPYPIWNEEMLELRANTYRITNSSYAATADRDLKRYRSQAGSSQISGE